jgi:hypothetical protein
MLLDNSERDGLGILVHSEKTKYMSMSPWHDWGQLYNKCWGNILSKQALLNNSEICVSVSHTEEMNLGNAGHYSVASSHSLENWTWRPYILFSHTFLIFHNLRKFMASILSIQYNRPFCLSSITVHFCNCLSYHCLLYKVVWVLKCTIPLYFLLFFVG